MLNHPSQSPSYHGRYPRTLEEGFGAGARLTKEVPGSKLDDALNVIAVVIGAFVVPVLFGVLLAWRG